MVDSALLEYWPQLDQAIGVLRSQAEGLSTPTLLAVHQPMDFQVEVHGHTTRAGKPAGQDQLLERVLAPAPNGYMIVPIIGASGVGKSHAIRWINAKIGELSDADRFHVVRVEKGASLRSVLGRLVQGLEGPAHSSLEEAMQGAREQLNEFQTAWALAGRLIEELQEPGDWLNESDDLNRIHRFWWQYVRAFLSDPTVWDEYLEDRGRGPMAILASNIRDGVDRLQDPDRQHEFTQEHFEVPDRILERLGDLHTAAQAFIRRANQPVRRSDIARLLNAALDPATRRLLQLSGESLTELFVEARRQLHAEGKEWVLLLEDLTALTGIRSALFELMVRGNDAEDIAEGRPLCAIRTVMAVTPGYLSGQAWDTIRTRAELLWKLEPNQPDEEADVERAVGFIGAYLNAARRGAEGLAQDFDARDGDDWRRAFRSADTNPTIRAFGCSREGYPLFPFNRSAIRQVLRTRYRSGARTLSFTPRDLISQVLNRVLDLRNDFTSGTFPSKAFGQSTLRNPGLVQTIASHNDDKTFVDRYQRLLAYWGDQPANAAEAARLDLSVPKAFGLEPIDFGVPAPVVLEQKLPVEPKKDVKNRDPLDKWKDTLADWRTGRRTLTQLEARKIRTAVSKAVVQALPVGWPGLPPVPDTVKNAVFLPRVGTGLMQPESAAVVVCSAEDLEHHQRATSVTFDLLTVLAIHDVGISFGDLEDDGFARYANFVYGHAPNLARWVRRHETILEESGLSTLGHGLTCASLVLGGPRARTKVERIHSWFRGFAGPSRDESRWGRLISASHELRELTLPKLAASYYAYQGRGRKPQALDASTLLSFVSEPLVEGDSLQRNSVDDTELSRALSHLRRSWKPGRTERKKKIRMWQRSVSHLMDSDTAQKLEDLVHLARAENVHVARDGEDFSDPLLHGLQGLDTETLEATFEKLSLGGGGSDWEDELIAIAGISDDVIRDSSEVVNKAEEFLKVVAPAVKQRLKTVPTSEDVVEAVASLRDTLAQIRNLVVGRTGESQH